MKKINYICTLILIFAFAVSGCSGNKSSSPVASETAVNSTPVTTPDMYTDATQSVEGSTPADSTTTPKVSPVNTPDKAQNNGMKNTHNADMSKSTPPVHSSNPPKQAPSGAPNDNFARADLTGEISAINGNAITIKIIRVTQPDRNSAQPSQPKDPGQKPGGITEYTGEVKTIKITSSTPITTFSRSGNGREAKNIALKDLKVGDTLQVWYSDKDNGVVSKLQAGSFSRQMPSSNNGTSPVNPQNRDIGE